MADNTNLNSAARAKKDKFYTQMEDIDRELYHYREIFRDKVILCNCDDPYESWFFKHFALRFNGYGLKKLITTSYADSPIAGTELILEGFADRGKKAFIYEVDALEDWNGDGRKDLDDVEFAIQNGIYKCTELTGDENYCAGDFRSKECIALLPQADIVVTNPPFSVFREYVKQLVDFDKKFLIIGNKNAITYKEIFPLIMQNKLWIGYRNINSDMWFTVPEGEEYEKIIDDEKVKHIMACWYTNLDVSKRYEDIPLFRDYYKNLVPACLIIYDRTAYYEPNGSLRLTIDENPRYRIEDLDLKTSLEGNSLLPEGWAILEIKVQFAMPLWLSRILDTGKIYKTSFSKYGEAYKREVRAYV